MRILLRPTPAGILTALAVASTTALAPVAVAAAPAAAAQTRQISHVHWDTGRQLREGHFGGIVLSHGKLRIGDPIGTRSYHQRRYEFGRWTSPWARPGFDFTELIPSWEAHTPRGTWIQVDVRAISTHHRHGSWDTIGRWTSGDKGFRRTTQGSQRDDVARVATDTMEANGDALTSWRMRITLYRPAGSTRTPAVDDLGAMTSAIPASTSVRTSRPGVARGIVLDVPRYSQMIHSGEYPRYGGGGEAWCSPTSTTMVLAYYDRLPRPSSYSWVNRSYPDRVVDHSARMTYDYGYGGTGNWPFNTAYAADRTGHAFVTRFASLRGVERFIAAGIPVVTSITFGRGQLDGAPISATDGHLVVVVGFTGSGDVVVNDPAARDDSGVRRVYDRGQFEDAWLPRSASGGGSGGLAYVIRDGAHPLPARHGNTNW
ncbi:MAG TPA: C39 family peptidase [Nocardioidaceae bacterium]|nr:C39 family peptidase [Nocardioidaceae bacterium]